ncbi:hypothetical protein CMO83_02060 [Candidatus Woesearchaeota archaeon]|jgi:hypothetical protein|nr:hypothetical protein [Candidatus Woesearchaeota archaeon]|tara:strand:+ start:1022 stop:1498 length:477 start_codon:yes stop_codon:yes gene_type:complete
MNKKAQIQIFETIAVVIVFFILVIIGFLFYANIIKGNLDIEKEELSQLKSVAIAQRAMFLPELQCSEDNIIRENCIDILKINSAKNIITRNQIYYYDQLEFSDITVSQIYPSEDQWTIYSRETIGYRNKFVTNVPVSLFDPIKKTYGFGILTIETLTK